MTDMPLEIARLLLGLVVAACHRRIADFMVLCERRVVLTFRQYGVPLPPAMTTQTARNFYFGIGLFIIAVEWLRIYRMVH